MRISIQDDVSAIDNAAKLPMLEALAAQVMGWSQNMLASDHNVLLEGDYRPVEGGVLQLVNGYWDPFTRADQAMDLLETWCRKNAGLCRHTIYQGLPRHFVGLSSPHGSGSAEGHTSFPATATLAICRAVGIDVRVEVPK